MKLTVTKIDGLKFKHPRGFQSGNGWGIMNEAGQFLTFENGSYPCPYAPKGGKETAQRVADTVMIDEKTKWVTPV